MRIRLALLVTVMLTVTPILPSDAADRGDRFALVIGNSKYPDADAPLKEPINDARDVAEELKRDGFNVEVGENLTADGMHRAFDRLYGRIKPGSVALVFFSGFGVQSNRQSFMIPVDATPAHPATGEDRHAAGYTSPPTATPRSAPAADPTSSWNLSDPHSWQSSPIGS